LTIVTTTTATMTMTQERMRKKKIQVDQTQKEKRRIKAVEENHALTMKRTGEELEEGVLEEEPVE
jgi:hypothetical protein